MRYVRTLKTLLLGLVLVADALVIDRLPDHPARRTHCDAVGVGPDGKSSPVCPIETGHHTLYVVLAVGLSVIAVLIASWLVRGRYQNAAWRQGMRGR